MHHARKFIKNTIDTSGIEEASSDSEEPVEGNTQSSQGFIWLLRQHVLHKVAEFQAHVLPLLRGTKLRIENYIEVELSEGGNKY
jgi:hypothetical protein